MKRKYLSLILMLAIGLASCRIGAPALQPISDPAKILDANAGEEFTIIIEANPSTGYHWELVDDLDKNLVEFVSKGYAADQPEKPGSGGVEIWKFRAIAPGTGEITLGYYPPGDSGAGPQQKVTFTVTVK